MADQNAYRPLADVDQGFPVVAEPTLGTMRRLYRLQVQTAALDRASREALAEKMCWDPEEVVTDEVAEDTYYVEMGKILFGSAFAKAVEAGDDSVNVREVLHAKAAFF